MIKTCVTCGDEFEFKVGKPGLATECMTCTLNNPSLRVRDEVRVAAEKLEREKLPKRPVVYESPSYRPGPKHYVGRMQHKHKR